MENNDKACSYLSHRRRVAKVKFENEIYRLDKAEADGPTKHYIVSQVSGEIAMAKPLACPKCGCQLSYQFSESPEFVCGKCLSAMVVHENELIAT